MVATAKINCAVHGERRSGEDFAARVESPTRLAVGGQRDQFAIEIAEINRPVSGEGGGAVDVGCKRRAP